MRKMLLQWLLNDYIKNNPIPRQFVGVVVIDGNENSQDSRKRYNEWKNCSQNTWNWFRKLLNSHNVENNI